MRTVVVGGGLGGLAAALALHRAGHEVAVLERQPEVSEVGAGIGLPPNGVLALNALGLGGQIRALADPLRTGAGLRDRLGRPLLVSDQQALERAAGAPFVVAPRSWLHGVLASALPAGTVRTGVTVDGPDDEALAGADIVVAADGARSRMRAALFPQHPGLVGSGEHAVRAIAPVDRHALDVVPGEFVDHRSGERFGCLPMAEGGVYWYSTWRTARSGTPPDEPAAWQRWLLARRADWHPSVTALISATPPETVHVTETAQLHPPLPTFVSGRVALLGDAAHAMTPDLGQGACQAFEDAAVLGAALTGATADDVPAALARYAALRCPRTAEMQRQARRINRLLGMTGPAARLRDAVFRRVPPAVAAKALIAQFRFEPAGTSDSLVR
jgi:2-polyprenyl-6-methoxyphenol hydroxylase-like FAD-dependent oxidoreductase